MLVDASGGVIKSTLVKVTASAGTYISTAYRLYCFEWELHDTPFQINACRHVPKCVSYIQCHEENIFTFTTLLSLHADWACRYVAIIALSAVHTSIDPRKCIPREDVCVACMEPWVEETEEIEKWISCSYCWWWFHLHCTWLEKMPPKRQNGSAKFAKRHDIL